ncbi:MAG: glycosyltransferase family 39 protein [Deltaproteobacteria bacterium]|nr:glycosyltransferase family 39 protein [Deltaproteobacteria bacterium]
MSAPEPTGPNRFNADLPAALIIALAAVPFVVFFRAIAARLTFPFDLEWIEGHMLAMATRVARGQALYPAPSIDYIPAPYFPLYFYLTAPLIELFGPEYWTGRLVSIVMSIGTAALVLLAVRKRTRNPLVALACASVFIASYGFTRTFFDLVRIDAAGIFFLVLAFHAVDPSKGTGRAVLAGAALTLAVLAKQNAILFYPAAVLPLLLANRRNAAVFTASFAVTLGAYVLIHNAASGGWFLKYTFALVGGEPMRRRYLTIPVAMLSQYAIPFAVVALGMVSMLARRQYRRFFADQWLAFFATSFVVSFMFRLTPGGAPNAYIPIAAGAAIGAGALLPIALEWFGGGPRDGRWSMGGAATWALAAILALQMVAQARWYDSEIPSRADREQAERLVGELRELEGKILMPGHVLPWDNTYWIHEMSWRDFNDSRWGRPVIRGLAEQMREDKPAYLVTEKGRSLPPVLRRVVQRDFQKGRPLPYLKMATATPSSPGRVHPRKDAP